MRHVGVQKTVVRRPQWTKLITLLASTSFRTARPCIFLIPTLILPRSQPLFRSSHHESRVGQVHRSIPNRAYDFSHWSCKLTATDGDDIPTFLGQLVTKLSQHRDYLHELSDGGGEIECFIGIFPDRLCDQLYPHNLLALLADLRINLRLDVYGENSEQPTA